MPRAANPALTRGLAEIVAERWAKEHGTDDPGLFVDFCAEAMKVAVERSAAPPVEVTAEDVAGYIEATATRCSCGYGGFHEDQNENCDRTQALRDFSDRLAARQEGE